MRPWRLPPQLTLRLLCFFRMVYRVIFTALPQSVGFGFPYDLNPLHKRQLIFPDPIFCIDFISILLLCGDCGNICAVRDQRHSPLVVLGDADMGVFQAADEFEKLPMWFMTFHGQQSIPHVLDVSTDRRRGRPAEHTPRAGREYR